MCQIVIDRQICGQQAPYQELVSAGDMVFSVHVCPDCLTTWNERTVVTCPICLGVNTEPVDNENGLYQCQDCDETFTRP